MASLIDIFPPDSELSAGQGYPECEQPEPGLKFEPVPTDCLKYYFTLSKMKTRQYFINFSYIFLVRKLRLKVAQALCSVLVSVFLHLLTSIMTWQKNKVIVIRGTLSVIQVVYLSLESLETRTKAQLLSII